MREDSGRRASWQRDFRCLWAGESVSLLGTQVTRLALPLTAAILLHADATAMGWLGAVTYAPFVLLGIPAGIIVDRTRRRNTLVAADLGLAVALAAVPTLAWLHALTLPRLVAAAFAAGCLRVFFELAYRSYLPALVPSRHLTPANARLSASESVAQMAGPSLGGLLVQAVGGPFALLADAASYLFSTAGLLSIRHREASPERLPERWHADLGAGFAFTLRSPFLRAFAGEAASYNFFWQMVLTVLVLFALHDLHLSPFTLGLVFATGAAGALVGAVATTRAAVRWGLGVTVLASAVLGDIAPLPLSWIPAGPAAAPLMATIFFIQGIGLTGCNVHAVAIRQAITPLRLQGRTNGAYRVLAYGVMPIGSLAGGALGATVGLRPTLLVGTAGLLTTALFLVYSPLRGLRSLQGTAVEAQHVGVRV